MIVFLILNYKYTCPISIDGNYLDTVEICMYCCSHRWKWKLWYIK